MDERNVVGGLFAVALSWVTEFLEPLRWMLLLGVILILVDLRFGIRAAAKRGEHLRFSRAIRRTLNKMVDYLCWVFLSCAISKAFALSFGNIIPFVVMGIIYIVEINSCFSNYFESRHLNIKVNVFKWFMGKTGVVIEENPSKNDIKTENKNE